jgi:hypothetical protein
MDCSQVSRDDTIGFDQSLLRPALAVPHNIERGYDYHRATLAELIAGAGRKSARKTVNADFPD